MIKNREGYFPDTETAEISVIERFETDPRADLEAGDVKACQAARNKMCDAMADAVNRHLSDIEGSRYIRKRKYKSITYEVQPCRYKRDSSTNKWFVQQIAKVTVIYVHPDEQDQPDSDDVQIVGLV